MKQQKPSSGRTGLDWAIAWMRLAVVLTAGLTVWIAPTSNPTLLNVWLAGLLYAGLIVAFRPQRFWSPPQWWILTGAMDALLVSLGVLLSGGVHSDFYVLYFLLVFGAGVRFGLLQSVLSASAIGIGYFALTVAGSSFDTVSLTVVLPRIGYLLAFAVSCGLLAREAEKETRADVHQAAEDEALRSVIDTLGRELRGPISAAAGLVDILVEPGAGELSPQQRTLLSGIEGNLEQASGLLRNVVAAEQIERLQHDFNPILADLNSAVQAAVHSFAHLAEARRIGLVLDLGASVPVVPFDEAWLMHALRNVLTNALEYTPAKGAVRVSTEWESRHFTIQVWNSGSCIPLGFRKHLFQKFARDRQSRGIGLGLYVARRIVELHHGKIAVENTEDGVLVSITLPCSQETPDLVSMAVKETRGARPRTTLATQEV